jgi:hypothetical protein
VCEPNRAGHIRSIDKELYGSKDWELKDIGIARGAGKCCSEVPKNRRLWLSVCRERLSGDCAAKPQMN